MKLILGSSSKYRAEVLRKYGCDFEVLAPDIDEKAIRTDDYYKLPLLIARAKMEAMLSKALEEAIIITADQVVICDGKLLEKPDNAEEAKQALSKYSQGYPAETVSALVVKNNKTGVTAEGVDLAKTFFKPIPDSAMEEFIASGEAFLCCGSFDHNYPSLAPYVEKIDGTPESVEGLPMHLLENLLKEVTQ